MIRFALALLLALALPARAVVLLSAAPGAGDLAAAPQTLGMAISNTTFVSNTPSGTPVGTVTVTVSASSPPFSGSVVLSTSGGCNATNGANNGNWQIVGSGASYSLESASDSLTSNQSVCLVAAQSGLVSVALRLTLTAAPAGYFVATNGSDSNAGTITAPFATLPKCQAAMDGSGGATLACYVRGGSYAPGSHNCSGTGSCVLELTTADNGQTWSYYPPDGYDSADFTGGSTGPGNGINALINFHTINGLTIDGFTCEHFQYNCFVSLNNRNAGANNVTIKNNIMHDITNSGPGGSGTIFLYNGTNISILHNVWYNTYEMGMRLSVNYNTGASGTINGAIIEYNFSYNTCLNVKDCGSIYFQDVPQHTTINPIIQYNFMRDSSPAASAANGSGIYLDDCLQGATVKYNVITGHFGQAYLIHAGNNNAFVNNIVDLTSYGNQNGGLAAYVALLATSTWCSTTMTGTPLTNNVIISNTNGGGGYFQDWGSPPVTNLIVQNNDYYAYSGPRPKYSGVNTTNSTWTDSAPQNVDPKLSGCYLPSPSSPIFSPPISFPALPSNWGQPGFWGPPGYKIPQNAGSLPSYPSPTC
jgi:hypothetical protein